MRCVDGWWIHDRAWGESPIQPISLAESLIDRALAYCVNLTCVLQAGARIGMWPKLLAQRVEQVLAFEPDAANYECAARNLEGVANVTLMLAALGEGPRTALLQLSEQSDGLHHITSIASGSTVEVAMVTIDQYELPRCDAIFLDVEGYELDVLRGAEVTLRRCHPVLVLEENSLCERYGRKRGDLARHMARYGYRVAEEFATLPPELRRPGVFHGADLILVHDA